MGPNQATSHAMSALLEHLEHFIDLPVYIRIPKVYTWIMNLRLHMIIAKCVL